VTDVLRVRRTVMDGVLVVHAVGEVDMTTAPHLAREIEQACAEAGHHTCLVIDLTGVSFLASAGLALLVRAQQRCREHGRSLRVVAPHRSVHRPITLTGLDEVLDVVPSIAHAVGETATAGRRADGGGQDQPPSAAGNGAGRH
jgi:anti-sigma B factor antagonist